MASTYKARLLSSAVMPMLVGVALVGVSCSGPDSNAVAENAAEEVQLAQANPCAVAANPCNPCAVANPCAAANPCNPCAAQKLIPAAANPCNPCAAANPCAAGANPCNPCAVAQANPCNPCAAANPCNPCAAGGAAYNMACAVPRLMAANPCNPCAAALTPAAANPCNPCAAANPCNPCAAANPCAVAANPCNPCAAANPCNPCAAGGPVTLTNAEAAAAWDCMMPDLEAAYAKSGLPAATAFTDWEVFSSVAYRSATHGNRYVQNMTNGVAEAAYGKYEDIGVAPAGATIAKPSITVTGNGQVGVGPLFLMEKMNSGFNAGSGDWRYTMVMPDGTIFGETLGQNSAGMQFCVDCHAAVGDAQDNLFFLPAEFRAAN